MIPASTSPHPVLRVYYTSADSVTVTFNEIEGAFNFDSGADALEYAIDNELTFLVIKHIRHEFDED